MSSPTCQKQQLNDTISEEKNTSFQDYIDDQVFKYAHHKHELQNEKNNFNSS